MEYRDTAYKLLAIRLDLVLPCVRVKRLRLGVLQLLHERNPRVMQQTKLSAPNLGIRNLLLACWKLQQILLAQPNHL